MYIIYYCYIFIVVYVSVKILSESSVILNKIILKKKKDNYSQCCLLSKLRSIQAWFFFSIYKTLSHVVSYKTSKS